MVVGRGFLMLGLVCLGSGRLSSPLVCLLVGLLSW